MNEEQKQNAILERLKEMGIQVDQPIYQLTWQDVARVMSETEGWEDAAEFLTETLVHALNTIQEGLEYLDWYENIQRSLQRSEQYSESVAQPNSEDGFLEMDYEDRISGIED